MTDYLIVASLGMAGFLVLWPISLIRRDASIVDFWWGPGFAVMVTTMWILSGASMDPHAQAMYCRFCSPSGRSPPSGSPMRRWVL